MLNQKDKLKELIIKAFLDSTPNLALVATKIDDPNFFEQKSMQKIFEELGIESLGRIWFLTVIEDEVKIKIHEPALFFENNAAKSLSEIVDIIVESRTKS